MILDGKSIAQKILNNVKIQVAQLPFQPVFCDVLVGEDPASAQYVRMKAKAAEAAGLKFRQANFPGNISTVNLISEIKKIDQEPNLCGLIIQLPLPAGLDRQAVLDAIDPKIDVDATGQVNTDLFYAGKAYLEFPTAAAIMAILDSATASPSGVIPSGQGLSEAKNLLTSDFDQVLNGPSTHSLRSFGRDDKVYKNLKFLVIGQGQLVGRPVSFLLKQRGYEVSIADEFTGNTAELLKSADVIITATGRHKLITGEKIKSGVIIIDAGTSESKGGIVGDVDFESVKNVASAVSPVPGGVGPVTVAMLLQNVLKVAKSKNC